MNDVIKWQRECVAKEIVEILKKRKFTAFYAEDKEAAKAKVLELIPAGASIGLGGSVTLNELDLVETFRNGDYNLIDRYRVPAGVHPFQPYKDALTCDVFVTSTNAITRDGELVNMDCTGNRVAAMSFGPDKVIVIAGVNKVVDTLYDAFERLKKIAPMNAKRIGHPVPCTKNYECCDCDTPARVCNVINIINNDMKFEGRINVIIVPEELGY